MVAPLRRVLVCPPRAAGWDGSAGAARWRDLGYLRPPDPGAARAQHEALCRGLQRAAAEVAALREADGLSLDAVYAHDASIMTDRGAIVLRMGKAARAAEPEAHAAFYRAAGVPLLGAIEAPGTVEGGDLLWIAPDTLLAGRGYRTSGAGIDRLRTLLAPLGVACVEAALPHGPGPTACLHLMSLISLLDERTALVDLAWLSVPTVELLRARGFDLVEIDPSERATLACNVLSLGDRRLLALEENRATNRRLSEAGFDVRTFPGSEIALNGSGGPTCLTRPLLRAS